MGDSNRNNGDADEPLVDDGELLLQAVQGEDVSRVQELLDKGANINYKNNNGWTPLHMSLTAWACWEGNLGIVKLLIDNGANVNAQDFYHDKTPLHKVCHAGNVEISKLLIENGADLNAKDNNKATPLHIASLDCYLDLVILLVSSGADVHAKDDDGETPLHTACNRRRGLEVVKFLVENGADLNTKNCIEKTPLCRAFQNRYFEIFKYLVANGANINQRDREDGRTPLHWTCEGSRLEEAELLIENGAFIDVKDHYGKTPVHWACYSGNVRLVQFLLSRGAKADSKTTVQGLTPLHVASERNHREVVWFLVRQIPWLVSECLE